MDPPSVSVVRCRCTEGSSGGARKLMWDALPGNGSTSTAPAGAGSTITWMKLWGLGLASSVRECKGVCRLGVALPFAPAAGTFTALTGVSISPREVERLAEGRGTALEARRLAWQEDLLEGQEVVEAESHPQNLSDGRQRCRQGTL
jgi:hypothetical protein